MSDDNTNKIGATITYDSQHALDAAKAYKQQLAGQLGHKLASRPYTPKEQKRNEISTRLLDATLGKRSLPSTGRYTGGTKTDSFLKKSGGDYSGWHRTSPVNMSSALDDDAFIRGAYQSLLGRDADAGGLAHWKADLASGGTRQSVVDNIKLHDEYKDKFINEAYKNLLGRDPDAGGLDYWKKAMKGGESEDSVIDNIRRSPEYGRRQQNLMRDAVSLKNPAAALDDAYDEQIATFGNALKLAQDAVQGSYGTAQDFSPLLTTNSTIYTQDPEASEVSSLNYLASQDPTYQGSPGIWSQALKDAGAAAIGSIDIPGLISGFFDSKKANKNPQTFLSSKAAREASDW